MRLLLAEDEEDLSKALVTLLKKNNYSVDAVYNGSDALDYILDGNYDGIILDIMMPKLNGIEVLKAIREKGITTPVLVLTAKSEIDDKVLGLDSGADDYMTKPFSMKELLARIRVMTRRSDMSKDNSLSLGNVTLDRNTYQIHCNNKSLKLPNKEYQMFEMLMSSPGRVINTELFFEKIWGYDSESELNVVWVYISYLRKKLSSIDANISIKASRGLGYYLEEAND